MASMKYLNCYINDYCTIVGPMEKNGQLKNYDYAIDDYYYGETTFENAEIKMQKKIINSILSKNKLNDTDIHIAIGGELFNQIAITTKSFESYNIPFLGIYSACATFVENLIIASNMLSNRNIKRTLVISSGHNLTAEKQFRYPIEYGAVKYKTNTFTSTGAVCALISKDISNIRIESGTVGKIINMGIKDVNNMGAVMAPAAANTIASHLNDLKREIDYYDLILTGDLGNVGSKLLKEYLEKSYDIKLKNYMDAGENIYTKNQDINSGASGPVALPLVLFTKILKSKKYKKILIVGTGSLHTPTLVNQKNTIGGIAHAISLEVQ